MAQRIGIELFERRGEGNGYLFGDAAGGNRTNYPPIQGLRRQSTAGAFWKAHGDSRAVGKVHIDVASESAAGDVGDDAAGEEHRRLNAADLNAKLHRQLAAELVAWETSSIVCCCGLSHCRFFLFSPGTAGDRYPWLFASS